MTKKLELERTLISLPSKQLKRLRREAAQKQISIAELIRRIVDAHFTSEGRNEA